MPEEREEANRLELRVTITHHPSRSQSHQQPGRWPISVLRAPLSLSCRLKAEKGRQSFLTAAASCPAHGTESVPGELERAVQPFDIAA